MNEEIREQRDEKLKQQIIMATAVREAMVEVVGENRDEIVKRARAKLVAQGIELSPEEVGAQL